MKFVKDLFTEADGVSYCPARMLWIFGACAFIILSFYEIYHGKDVSLQDYGFGYGSLLAGGGWGVKSKGAVE